MLAGREITGGENETPELAAQRLIFNSIFYAVGTRCGFDLGSGEPDLGAIVNVKDEGCISVLGTLVSDVSCTVLRNMNREIMSIEKERKARRMGHSPDKFWEKPQNLQQNQKRMFHPLGKGGRNGTGNQLPRGRGRDAVPGHQGSRADRNRDIREVRNHGEGVSGGKLPAEIPKLNQVWESLHETERSGGGGKQDVGKLHGEVSGKTQTGESKFHNGDVPHQETGNDGGRGNHPSRHHQPVSLETQEELNKELDDLNLFGKEREAVFRQASLFDIEKNATDWRNDNKNAEGILAGQRVDVAPVDYKETGMDDGEEEEIPEPEVQDAQEQLDGYAIPDEATRWEYRMPCGLSRHSGRKGRRHRGSVRNQEGRKKKGMNPICTNLLVKNRDLCHNKSQGVIYYGYKCRRINKTFTRRIPAGVL